MEAIKKTAALTTVQESDKPSIQEETQLVNGYDVDAFLEMRKEFITKVNKIMVEGKDYHVIQGKKSLAKGGAEKIASIFGWSASFSKDQDVAEAFNDVKGLISFVCRLQKSGSAVGEGRGAAVLAKNCVDPNKTIKMAQKSAFIDAILRASGLSDFFTQDLEDMPRDQISQSNFNAGPNLTNKFPAQNHDDEKLASPKQLQFIKSLMKDKGIEKLSDIGFKPSPNGKNLPMYYAKQIIDKLLTLDKEEVEVVENSVDKARRILNASVPKGDYPE